MTDRKKRGIRKTASLENEQKQMDQPLRAAEGEQKMGRIYPPKPVNQTALNSKLAEISAQSEPAQPKSRSNQRKPARPQAAQDKRRNAGAAQQKQTVQNKTQQVKTGDKQPQNRNRLPKGSLQLWLNFH